MTHAIASTRFDFPEPFGPTTTVTPGSHSIRVRSANDLKPTSESVLRCTGTTRLSGGNHRYVVPGCRLPVARLESRPQACQIRRNLSPIPAAQVCDRRPKGRPGDHA